MSKKQVMAEIIRHTSLSDGIFDMTLKAEEIAKEAEDDKEIKQYAELRAMGESTLYERMEMLINHRKALNIQILSLQEHMSKLDDKITFYQNEIERVQKQLEGNGD